MCSQSKGIGSVHSAQSAEIWMPRAIKPAFRRNVERLLRHKAMPNRAYSASV
jgi:hypothetical protein